MKARVNAFLGLALMLLSIHNTQGMSSLSFLSIEPEWPDTTTPGTVILYRVTAVSREGQGLLEVWFNCLGLPDTAIVACTPTPLRFTGNNPVTLSAVISVKCAELTPTDTFPFTLTATAQRESMTITNQPTPPLYTEISGPPVLALDLLTNNGLKLRGRGAPGQTYTVETTTDLGHPNWTAMGTSTADGNGRFSFFPARDAQMRFYRAVWSPPGALTTSTDPDSAGQLEIQSERLQ